MSVHRSQQHSLFPFRIPLADVSIRWMHSRFQLLSSIQPNVPRHVTALDSDILLFDRYA
jgi:hypothetical protein